MDAHYEFESEIISKLKHVFSACPNLASVNNAPTSGNTVLPMGQLGALSVIPQALSVPTYQLSCACQALPCFINIYSPGTGSLIFAGNLPGGNPVTPTLSPLITCDNPTGVYLLENAKPANFPPAEFSNVFGGFFDSILCGD
jgi:hypothetical protein